MRLSLFGNSSPSSPPTVYFRNYPLLVAVAEWVLIRNTSRPTCAYLRSSLVLRWHLKLSLWPLDDLEWELIVDMF